MAMVAEFSAWMIEQQLSRRQAARALGNGERTIRHHAESVASALGAYRSGRDWMARCPAHADHTPSLALSVGGSGKILVYCHAGCSQASVIAALRERGLWGDIGKPKATAGGFVAGSPKRDKAHLTDFALRVWHAATHASGSLAEAYLQARGLHLTSSETLRFHPGLRHPCGSVLPAMIALVARGNDHQAVGIHRTFLKPDGRGKAAVEPQRMMLGPCRGGAVQLASVSHGDTLLVGEGIETTLAAMQAKGHPGWAALSAPGLRALDLPPRVRQVIVLADGDDAGEAAALAAGQRWANEGRQVGIARAPRDLDFNDMLLSHAAADEVQNREH
jgi:putative DNA primase/helicase